MSESSITSLAAIAGAIVIMLAVPVGVRADRSNRLRLVRIAAVAWGTMTVLTGISGLVGAIGLLFIARFGAGLGRVMNEPVHASLLADWYEPARHGRIYSIHRMANPLGHLHRAAAAACSPTSSAGAGVHPASPSRRSSPSPSSPASRSRPEARRSTPASPCGPTRGPRRSRSARPTGGSRRSRRLDASWTAGFFLGAGLVPIAVFFNFFFEEVYGLESATVPRASC